MNKVLLTGATGFIGSHVARLLVNSGTKVFALIRENSNLWRIQDILSEIQILRADLHDSTKLKSELGKIKPDICIHLAWYLEPRKYTDSLENISMLHDSLNFSLRLAEAGCRRIVGVGTCFEYKMGSECLSESSPVKPQTLYAACKLSLLTILEQISRQTGMEVIWPRPFYLYGPYESEKRLVPSVICSLLRNQPTKTTKGEQVRDYLHVSDVASALWAVTRSKLSGPVNIGSGKPVTVGDIVELVGKIINKPELIKLGALPYGPDENMYICADNRRLLENTDWKPQYSLEQGLRETIEWWKNKIALKER